MFELFQMWALVEAIGLVSLPLTVTVFRNVPDRGWAWSKALGIVVLVFLTWFPLMLIETIPYSQVVLIVIALVFLALMVIGFFRTHRSIRQLLRTNYRYIIVTEGIFLVMMLIFGWLRAFAPNIQGYETYMDEGFLASIMRGPNLPPHDMWYAGYSINYYYYGHYIVATLGKILGQAPSIAFNTGIIMLFALTGSSIFGLTCNIVSWAKQQRKQQTEELEALAQPASELKHTLIGAAPYGILSILMGVVFGNIASAGAWWNTQGRTYDWFSPSRVIPNTINEFPSFSFLLSDFHAHVLTLAFTFLAMGIALNLFLAPRETGFSLFGRGWQIPITLCCSALVLGGLFVMNGWDFPIYTGLAVICIVLQQWMAHDRRLRWSLVLDIFSAVASLVALAFLFFLPFYLHFISPAQGIGILPAQDRSSIGEEILISGLFFFLFLSFLLSSAMLRPLRKARIAADVDLKEAVALQERSGGTDPVMVAVEPVVADKVKAEDAAISWSLIGIVCGIGFFLIGIVCLVISPLNATLFMALGITLVTCVVLLRHLAERSHAFALLLGAMAFALITVCEIVYLRDVFPTLPRMNTVFKFYFAVWALFSVSSGVGLYFILEHFSRMPVFAQPVWRLVQSGGKIVWSVVLIFLCAVGAVYPIIAPYYRYQQNNPVTGQVSLTHTNSLDGLDYMQHDPTLQDDYYAIRWLNANVQGDPGIIEASGNVNGQGNDYTTYDRISSFTGLPTPMGWIGHEYQWRIQWYNENPANYADSVQRINDVDQIYINTNSSVVLSLMARYQAQYVYVGSLERSQYAQSDLNRFASFMQVVYQRGNVTIYKVKGTASNR